MIHFLVVNGSSVSATNADIRSILNLVNVAYKIDIGLEILISAQFVMTTNTIYTSSIAGTLAGQLRTNWNTNRKGIARNVAFVYK